MVRKMDRAIWGNARWGYGRWGVKDPTFEMWVSNNITYPISLRKRILGETQDSTTGFFTPTWAVSTIDTLLSFGPTATQSLPVGDVGNLDGTIRCVDPIRHGDEFKWRGDYYKIVTEPRAVLQRDGSFICYKAGFRKQELRA